MKKSLSYALIILKERGITMKHILVTGGAGFIGSNFVKYMLEAFEYKIVNLDLLTYAGNLENLREVESHPNYTFIKGDIRDRELLDEIFREYQIDTVINFAAESHVDRSIVKYEYFRDASAARYSEKVLEG